MSTFSELLRRRAWELEVQSIQAQTLANTEMLIEMWEQGREDGPNPVHPEDPSYVEAEQEIERLNEKIVEVLSRVTDSEVLTMYGERP